MMIVCGVKLFNIVLFLYPKPFNPSSLVEPINNKSLYLFTVRRALVQEDIQFTKPFNILTHPRLLPFAQSYMKITLPYHPSCEFRGVTN